MPTPFKLSRRKLKAAGACSLDYFFDAHPDAHHGVITYPNGWTEAETLRLATDKPVGLLWLAQRGLIPVSYKKAKDKVKEVHGAMTYTELMVEYHRARGTFPAQPPPPPPP
jgi:hypothetical protein